jgi:hypothetical protein
MLIKDLITSRVCGNTVFEESWIWYCDECQQHGTAISSQEANFMATAHYDYHSDDGENYGCNLFIIDEENNITYEFEENYEDKTPNKVTDLNTMLQLQKDLGLQ